MKVSWRKLFDVTLLFLLDSPHCKELVGGNIVEGKRDAELEGSAKVKRPAQELPSLGVLGGLQAVQRAFVAPGSLGGRVRAEINVAQLLAPQRPIYKEAQRGAVGPLRS